jgi:hypothetical protein
VADQEVEPAYAGKGHGQPFARTFVVRIAPVLPEIPIDRQQPESDRREVLLHLEHALRLPETVLLDRNAHVHAVLGVNPCTEEEDHNPQHADRRGVARPLHGAKARDEPARDRRLAHRHQNGHGLVRQRAEQRHRQQRMDGEQDGPVGVDRDVVEQKIRY